MNAYGPVVNSDGHRSWKYAPQVLLEILFCCAKGNIYQKWRESTRIYKNALFFLIQVVPYIESPLFHQGQKAEAFKKKGNERLKDDGWVPQKAVSNDCGYQWHTPYIPILIILNIYI